MAERNVQKVTKVAMGSGAANLTTRVRSLRDLLLTDLVERDDAIRLALLATLAGEHLLLIGPPGTAKSLLARRLRLAFKDSTYFERLLTRFTVPEELFGPLSIKALEEDRYERLTDKYLPTASVAFLDEIFKANSAILNALLTLLNEREFDNGVERQSTPLIAVIGASNELPEGEELAALYDRFLMRLHVGPVSGDGFEALLALRGDHKLEIPENQKLTAEDLNDIRERSEAIVVPEDVSALLVDLRKFCQAEKLPVSDRRWRKIVKLLQVSTFTNGRDTVSIWDCWLLQHCLWDEPKQRDKIYKWYAERVGVSAAMDPGSLTKVVVAWEGQLRRDQEAREQQVDSKGRPLFQSGSGKGVLNSRGLVQRRRDGKPLFVGQSNWSDRHRYGELSRSELDNGGKGYTADELDELYAVDGSGNRKRVRDWTDRENYMAKPGSWFTKNGDLPPKMGPKLHKPIYVDDCLKQIDELASDVADYEEKLASHVRSLEEQVRVHLWVSDDFAEPAADSLEDTRQAVEVLKDRVANLRKSFGCSSAQIHFRADDA